MKKILITGASGYIGSCLYFYLKKKYNVLAIDKKKNSFLEGTGSIVLDRFNKIAYASISERTDLKIFKAWCKEMNYKSISFPILAQKFLPLLPLRNNLEFQIKNYENQD